MVYCKVLMTYLKGRGIKDHVCTSCHILVPINVKGKVEMKSVPTAYQHHGSVHCMLGLTNTVKQELVAEMGWFYSGPFEITPMSFFQVRKRFDAFHDRRKKGRL